MPGRGHQLLRHRRRLFEGRAEQILGKALGARRKDVVVATKVRGRIGPGPNDVGLSRGHIMDSVDASLRRLGTDHIDLYQIHGFDALTPLEETLRALDDLVRAGKVRYIGASNLAAWQLMKALGISERDGLARFETLQAYYSIAGRDLERELVPLHEDPSSVGLMVWSPLAGGFLSGKFAPQPEGPRGRAPRHLRLPAGRQGARLRGARRARRDRRGARRLGGARGARLAAAPARHDQRDHRRRNDAAARRQPRRRRRQAHRRELQRLDEASALPPEYPGWMITVQSRDRLEVITMEKRFAPVK